MNKETHNILGKSLNRSQNMSTVSKQTLKKDILTAIKEISDLSNWKAYFDVVCAYLLGDEDSWIYEDCIIGAGFGDYTSLNEEHVEEATAHHISDGDTLSAFQRGND